MEDLHTEMVRRYREGGLPWDQPLPPPEVIAIAERLAPGRALDLGCGPGRSAIYLASLGWQCDGVDFVPEAIERARQNARARGVAGRIRFHVASVTRLDFLDEPYDLAIDVGCLHAQQGDDLQAYARELSRLLRPGGHYLLFARMLNEPDEAGPRGLRLSTVHTLFQDTFTIDHVEHGVTDTGETQWASAWFSMRRRSATPDDGPGAP